MHCLYYQRDYNFADGVTNSQLTCDHCPTRPLCLGYTLADTTCGGNLTVNGFNVTINDSDSQVQQIRISLNGSVFELSENVSYDVRVIHEVCEGAELFSLQHLLVENSTSCNSTINRMNEIVINCDGENFNPGAEMGLFVTDCSGNCTDSIYIIGKFFEKVLIIVCSEHSYNQYN